MRDMLPNASFLVFIGTPALFEDKKTRVLIDDYVSIYDIQNAMEYGGNVLINYESRSAKLDLII